MTTLEMKIGVTVIVSPACDDPFVSEITGETPKYWRVDKSLYSKTGLHGGRGDSDYYHSSIRLPKDGEVEKIKEIRFRRALVKQVDQIAWDMVKTEAIETIIMIAKANP